MGRLLAVIGSQWGDEGKGKIVDMLSSKFDAVVRFNGGNNAGHTVKLGKNKYPLSLMPSGVLHKKNLYISQGVVINLEVLLREIKQFKPKLTIDHRAHIVMPYHQLLDAATEEYKGAKKVGSLKLGIGYCYEDKNNRSGIRVEDLLNKKKLREKIERVYELKKNRVEKVFGSKWNLNCSNLINQYTNYGKRIKKYVGDVSLRISKDLKTKRILFEGAHGTFLDCVYGTYPYTVAIHTISGSIFPYVGIPSAKLHVMGVVKAYTTRVGNGPFTTELFNKIGSHMQKQGNEFGTVSKRPRRCGWLDLDMVTEANRLNGFSSIALTKLDVLSGLPKLKVYFKKKYHTLPGWNPNISTAKKQKDLPINCFSYLRFIEKKLKIKIKYISVGPERNQTIVL